MSANRCPVDGQRCWGLNNCRLQLAMCTAASSHAHESQSNEEKTNV